MSVIEGVVRERRAGAGAHPGAAGRQEAGGVRVGTCTGVFEIDGDGPDARPVARVRLDGGVEVTAYLPAGTALPEVGGRVVVRLGAPAADQVPHRASVVADHMPHRASLAP